MRHLPYDNGEGLDYDSSMTNLVDFAAVTRRPAGGPERNDPATPWNLAGLMPIDQPCPPGYLWVPREVRLGEFKPKPSAPYEPCLVHWGWESTKAPRRGRLFFDFVALWDAPPEKVLRFAQRLGVLESFTQKLGYRCKLLPAGTGSPFRDKKGWYVQPLSTWRRFASEARAVLNIAARLHLGKPGADEDWRTLSSDVSFFLKWHKIAVRGVPWKEDRLLPPHIEVHRHALGSSVQYWLNRGNVGLRFLWDPREPRPTLKTEGYGLLGRLALELSLSVSRVERFAFCSACGESYAPKRQPQAGRKNFCKRCGKKAAWRAASEKYRLKASASSPEFVGELRFG
jgi:hypothetical protein